MYIIIAGGGVVGRKLTQKLVKNHDVVIIDLDKQTCEKIYAKYGAVSIHGNATKIETLKEAGINKCDIAIGVMRYDSDNLAFSLLANDSGVDRIFARMRESEYRSAYKLAGATNIGASIEMLVNKFFMDIEEPDVRKVVSISEGKAEISIVKIPKRAKCAGKTISEIVKSSEFPQNCVIAGIFDKSKDKLIIPRGNKKIHGNNQVFLVAPEKDIHQAANFLMRK